MRGKFSVKMLLAAAPKIKFFMTLLCSTVLRPPANPIEVLPCFFFCPFPAEGALQEKSRAAHVRSPDGSTQRP